jgi:glutathione peroxidase
MIFKTAYSKIKKASIVLVLCILIFSIYVIIANSNSKNMTTKQKVLKAVYPMLMWFTKKAGVNSASISNTTAEPIVPFYSLTATLINGVHLNMADYKGKKILLVNTASDCGYTGQYDALEKLYQLHKDKLVVIGFPANDFKEQETASDESIASFCKLNFGVTFPLMKKSVVIKTNGQNELFEWLSNKNKNGWNDQAPTWNFCKYLVNENGRLTHFFASSVEPLSTEVLKAIAE